MDHLPLTAHGGGSGKVVDAYKKALTTAASAAAYAVLVRSMARELLPDELRAAVRWGAAFVKARLGRGARERHTLVIRQQYDTGYGENHLFDAARAYLAARINPCTMRRLCLVRHRVREPDGSSGSTWNTQLYMEPGGTTTDVFDGVEFRWTSVETDDGGGGTKKGRSGSSNGPRESLELSFDAEHTDVALDRYVPFIVATAEDMMRRDRALRIFMNEGRSSWYGITHHHPATFDTLAMDRDVKQSVVADLDRFLRRREYYRRIGKAWKRGYLLHGPPGTGKSSLVAAMANHLRFNLYDLDLSEVHTNLELQRLLIKMPNKSILVIEDIDCCLHAAASSREDGKVPAAPPPPDTLESFLDRAAPQGAGAAALFKGITLSGLLNVIDGLWSTCGEERIIVFTTNYKERLDPALLRPGRMDKHVYMGYCGWEAFKTLARNYFLVDDHPLFPELKTMISEVEVTPAEVSEMLLRSEDVDVALRVLSEFLQKKKQGTRNEAERTSEETEDRKNVTEESV